MRTLSVDILAGIYELIPFPVFLVEVRRTPALYWTTAEIPDWNGHTWQTFGLTVASVTDSSATLKIANGNNAGSSLVLNSTLRDIEMAIYCWYNGDAFELFTGYGSDASVAAMEVTITLLRNRAANALVPYRRIAAPTFTLLPKLGQVIVWGNESYKVTF